MAWCLIQARSHYLIQWRLLFSQVLWHSSYSSFMSAQTTILNNAFQDYNWKMTSTSPRYQWVNVLWIMVTDNWFAFIFQTRSPPGRRVPAASPATQEAPLVPECARHVKQPRNKPNWRKNSRPLQRKLPQSWREWFLLILSHLACWILNKMVSIFVLYFDSDLP